MAVAIGAISSGRARNTFQRRRRRVEQFTKTRFDTRPLTNRSKCCNECRRGPHSMRHPPKNKSAPLRNIPGVIHVHSRVHAPLVLCARRLPVKRSDLASIRSSCCSRPKPSCLPCYHLGPTHAHHCCLPTHAQALYARARSSQVSVPRNWVGIFIGRDGVNKKRFEEEVKGCRILCVARHAARTTKQEKEEDTEFPLPILFTHGAGDVGRGGGRRCGPKPLARRAAEEEKARRERSPTRSLVSCWDERLPEDSLRERCRRGEDTRGVTLRPPCLHAPIVGISLATRPRQLRSTFDVALALGIDIVEPQHLWLADLASPYLYRLVEPRRASSARAANVLAQRVMRLVSMAASSR